MDEKINLSSISKVQNEVIGNDSYINSKISLRDYSDKEIKDVGKEFEKIFCKYLVESMYKSVEVFNEDAGFERIIWQGFFNEEIAAKIVERYDLGISDAISRQIALQYQKENPPVDENTETMIKNINDSDCEA